MRLSTPRAHRYASRLRRLGRVALNIPRAAHATGGWAGLGRQLLGARSGGWRDVYGMLIGLVATGGRRRGRWYREWLDRNEAFGVDAGTRLAVVASPDDLENLAGDRTGAVFVRPGYRLHDAALPAMENAVANGAELVYGDADEIDPSGRRCRPFFKPDFSLDLFLHQDYLSDCIAVSREVLDRVPPWDFEDPYGTLLRWLPSVSRIEHLPQILSHALEPPARTQEPPRYLGEYLRARYGDGTAVETVSTPSTSPLQWRCRFGSYPETGVTVVIPTRDRLDLLRPCIDSVFATDTASEIEVLVIDNGSSEPATRRWLREVQRQRSSLRVLDDNGDFNWSRLNNLGIADGTGDVFVFLNNDTLAIEDRWLDRLAEYALREDVGAVGPLLLFANGNVQHAGLVVGYGDHADSIYRGTAPDFDDHAFVSPRLPRNVAAVTGACLATSRRTLDRLGSFDESLALAGDVEFCLRAHAAGFVNVFAGDVAVRHYESATIGRSLHGVDGHRLGYVVQGTLPQDPFYNPNLARIAGVGRGAPAFALLHEDPRADHLQAVARGRPSA